MKKWLGPLAPLPQRAPMILIHPPIFKPSEPPPGIARLKAFLLAHGISCTTLDLNLEGILWMLEHPPQGNGRWSRRAVKNAKCHLDALREVKLYQNVDRYKRAVHDLSHVLHLHGAVHGVQLNLSNYQHHALSPLRSEDLVRSAENPEKNPFSPHFKTRITAILEKTGSEWVGISLNFLHQALTTFAILGFLRRDFPHVKLVLGGGLITSWKGHFLQENPFAGLVDHLVQGRGEEPLLALLRGQSREGVHPPPDYSDFPFSEYISPAPVLPYSASTGCYWNKCAFCPERAEGNPYIPIAPARVLKDLRQLQLEHRPGLIHFLDNALSPSLLRAMADDPPPAPWYGFARISEQLEDLSFCHALRKSGCLMLKTGVESGDEAVMEEEGKGTSVALASRVIKNLRKAGIAVYAYFLFGTPSETEKEARKTLQFIVDHEHCIQFMNVALFNMPIRGPHAAAFPSHAHYEGDLSLYRAFEHPEGWNRRQVRHFLERKFKKHESVAAILKREPPFFTSNHAPFFK